MPATHLVLLTLLTVLLSSGCATPRPASSSASTPLYPPIEARQTGFLTVENGHSLYYEESGNPNGLPVVFLHGGPGSGTKPKQRQLFDPKAYRIILYDQAGAGKSQSRDPLAGNDTWSLVRHLEALRLHLGVEKWLLLGGSWGTTLALAYAEAHPGRVTGIITWGAFLSRPAELDWLYKKGGVSSIQPEAFERFASLVPARDRGRLVRAYLRLFRSRDPLVRREAVRRWTDYEDVLSVVEPEPPETLTEADLDGHFLNRALIEAHYMAHGGFLNPRHNELLEGIGKLRAIPITIIAGRYDLVCPIMTAYEIHERAPWSELRVLPLSGHASFSHPAVISALVEATDRFAHSSR